MKTKDTGRRSPWQIPGAPLDVTCWCERKMRRASTDDVRYGRAGWSCGHADCERMAPQDVAS